MSSDPLARFINLLATSLTDDTFVRLVLSSPVGSDVEKVIGRLVALKTGPHLSLTYRYATRDVVKNIPVTDAPHWLPEQIPGKFRSALLGTTKRDWQLHDNRLVSHKPATTAPPARTHDQARPSVLDESARVWLPADADKRRQIDRYAEIFSHLAADAGWINREPKTENRELIIADMGCGKGYLTFAVWHLMRGRSAKIIGVEQRPELVANANRLAKQIGATGLEFVTGTIATVNLPALDGLIALHACDTATDDAIRRGVAAQAQLIIVAPCCHQEVRPQLEAARREARPPVLAPVLAHGLMAARMAEWATDGLRALALEAAGYRVKMIEFVASEHTPKNLMIAAVRTGQPTGNERLEAFRQFFGIQHHSLLECGGLTPASTEPRQTCVKPPHSK